MCQTQLEIYCELISAPTEKMWLDTVDEKIKCSYQRKTSGTWQGAMADKWKEDDKM